MLAAVLRDEGVGGDLTIGTDEQTAASLEAMGIRHVPCAVGETCRDDQRPVVSTPAYMLGQSISEVAEGIEKLVDEVMALAGETAPRGA